MFFKIRALKIFPIFIGRHLYWSLFLKDWQLQNRCFPAIIVKFLRTAFFVEHLRWLLLKVGNSVLYLFAIFVFQAF